MMKAKGFKSFPKPLLGPFLIFFFGLFLAQAHPGIGIVQDSKGNIYYTDLSQVWKITPDGSCSIAVPNVHTHELFIDADDNLYGEHEWYKGETSDQWGNYVWCLDAQGQLGKPIPEVTGFLKNTTLVRNEKGDSFWVDRQDSGQTLMVQAPDGSQSRYSDHGYGNVRWMHYSNYTHNLYIIDTISLKQVDATGTVTTLVKNLKAGNKEQTSVADHHYAFGIWTDSQGSVYVALLGAGQVKKIDSSGKLEMLYQSPKGWSPCGGLWTKDGNQWILEFSDDHKTRVLQIAADGTQTHYNCSN